MTGSASSATDDFPALFVAADWIENHCAVPDGEHRGELLGLVDWQLKCVVNHYRIRPEATVGQRAPAFHYRRSQIVMGQKAGKSPTVAAFVCVEGVGPALFAGFADGGETWDCRDHGCGCGWVYEYPPGEPMGRPWPTPLVQITAFSEDQPLALDTPVPTPDGWTTVGSLRVGDMVFGSDGWPVEVKRSTETFVGERCFRVTFDDGESVVASARHGWTLDRLNGHGDAHETVTVTTEQMAADHRDFRGRKRYRLGGVGWQLPEAKLGIDPYLLGLWLGDGSTADAGIAIDWRDRDEMEEIVTPLLEWFETITWHHKAGTNVGVMRLRKRPMVCPWGHDYTHDLYDRGRQGITCAACARNRGKPHREPRLFTLREKLRNVGVLGHKHIPATYLRGSEDQRLALLQGLIDSDGSLDAKGMASFCNVNERLIDQVGELLTSLGFKWRKMRSAAAWRLFFTPGDGRPVTRLRRKTARQKPWGVRSASRWRYVASVEECPSVPVRCIGIDTADHLFLVGRRGVLTHNTDNVYDVLRPMIQGGPLAEVIPKTGEEFIRLPGGGRIDVVTSSARSRLGQRVTFAAQGETGIWTPETGMVKVAETQRRGLAGMGGRALEETNAWDPAENSVAQRTAESKSPDIFRHHPRPSSKLSYTNKRDRRKIHELVYKGSWWVDLDAIEAEAKELIEVDPAQAERFFGNRPESGGGMAFNVERWRELYDGKHVVPDDALVVVGVDGARFDDALAMVATEVETGYQWPLGVWEVPENAPDDYEHPFEDVDAVLSAAWDRYSVWRVYIDPQYIERLVERWQGRWGEKQVIEWRTNRDKPMAYAVRKFTESLKAGDLSHDGDSVVARHIANSRKKKVTVADEAGRQMWLIQKERPMSPKKMDAAVASVLSWEARGDAVAAGATGKRKAAYFF